LLAQTACSSEDEKFVWSMKAKRTSQGSTAQSPIDAEMEVKD